MKIQIRRRLTWTAVVLLLGVFVFLLGPTVVRTGYALTVGHAEINALTTKCRALEIVQDPASNLRRVEILEWLAMRRVLVDDGIRDEGVDHASMPFRVYGQTCWAWGDLFRYWRRPLEKRSVDFLLSEVPSAQILIESNNGMK